MPLAKLFNSAGIDVQNVNEDIIWAGTPNIELPPRPSRPPLCPPRPRRVVFDWLG